MRILLIMPDAHIHRLRVGPFVRSMREAPLTLTTLAALAPPELNIQFEIADGSVGRVPEEGSWDLVGISVLTGTAPAAYRLARHYRDLGVPVVLGGVHVTVRPEEARRHADTVVVGHAERSWPQLLRDFAVEKLRHVYRNEGATQGWLRGLPSPRLDLQDSGRYMMPQAVMATRGCRGACDFCSVPVAHRGYVKRPVGEVIREIDGRSGRLFVFNDVNLVEDIEYAKELFRALIPLRRIWGGLATTRIARDPELLDLMARSGCRYLLIGFESTNPDALAEIHKGFNSREDYHEVVRQLHDRNISVQGCFIFGFDHDDTSVFPDTIQRINELRIDIPRYAICTPYPGTPLYARLSEEGRILSRNWEDYDTMHVVFEPARMTPEELYRGFKWAYRETFRLRSIARRTRSAGLNGIINLLGNLTYRRFVHRLQHDARYALPYTGSGRHGRVIPCHA